MAPGVNGTKIVQLHKIILFQPNYEIFFGTEVYFLSILLPMMLSLLISFASFFNQYFTFLAINFSLQKKRLLTNLKTFQKRNEEI